jgi:hypothetical protein
MSERKWFRRNPTAGYPGDIPEGVVGEAIRAGWAAGNAGVYDEWSFEYGHPIPYLARLEAEKGLAVQEEMGALADQLLEIRQDYREDSQAQASERTITEEEEEYRRTIRTLSEERRDAALAHLDSITGVYVPLPPGYDPEAPPPEQPPADPEAEAEQPDRQRRWPGPPDGSLVPPVPRWLKNLLVLLLFCVEIPIYYQSFRPFDRSVPMVLLFTVPVALSMVLGPHLAGIWLRQQKAVPPPGRLPVVGAGLIMLAWAVGTVLLAGLRRNALLTTQVVENQSIQADLQGMSPNTVTAIFALLLVLSGLLSFMLGLADEHPGITGLRATHAAAEAAAEDHLDAVAERAEAHIDDLVPVEEQLAFAQMESDARIGAIIMEYQAARAAYLDAVALALADPAMTMGTSAAVATPAQTSRSEPAASTPDA